MTEPAPRRRTQVRRLPDRGRYDHETIYAILDEGFLCHVGFNMDGSPVVIPTLYGRDGDRILLHGSAASRMLRNLETGAPACVTVTLVDGLVLARSAFHHSMNYRSVVAFGSAQAIANRESKLHALERISENVAPGRWAQVRPPTDHELKATSVLEFAIEEASAKIRTGPPKDDDEDYGLPVWAGVAPVRFAVGKLADDGRLAPGAPAPGDVFNPAWLRTNDF